MVALALALLFGFVALELHAPFAAEKSLGDLGATVLLQDLLHQAADGGLLLALAREVQDFGHFGIRKLDAHFHVFHLVKADSFGNLCGFRR